jgi:aminoglycoside/choline kinase family phosphotransferase
MVALTRLPVFVAARIARTQEAFTPVWPGRKFHELTGQRPARLTAPPQRGHNSHVWRVQTQTGEELKLYRFDHGQSAGQMVKLLSLLRESGFRVPSVLEFDDAEGWVIAEWIAGAPLTLEAMQDRKSLEEVAGFQASLNQVALPRAQFQRRFSYFHHLVFERYLHWTDGRSCPRFRPWY